MALREILIRQRQVIQTLEEPPIHLPQSERNFLAALRDSKLQPAIIAELKPKSPSHGVLAEKDYHPADQARRYEEGGAAALSVLTERHFFGGKLADLTCAKQATQLPVLCKDFILDVKQVKWARHAGADACLLIVAALDAGELLHLKETIESYDMLAVIEVHTREELDRALLIQPKVILINNRNLWDLSMHPQTTATLFPFVPQSIPVISASGFSGPEDVQALPKGIQAVLIGTQLMKASASPRDFLRSGA